MSLSDSLKTRLLSALRTPEAKDEIITAIESGDITDGEVTTAKLADDAVTNVKVATGIDAVKLADGSVTNTELQYLGGVTSDVQSQLDGKQETGNYLTGLTGDVTAAGPGVAAAVIGNEVIYDVMISAAAAIDATKIADGTVTSAEFQYLGGVTSDLQTQLDGKQATISGATGTFTTVDSKTVTVTDGIITSIV